ncbi:MAG TPA: carboxymuconolactone decarboxylase family protein [Flavobacteriales bacterium]|nr:carboxymuconolactone decarboxylase family protein [Flavobacteriales bacterium]
MTQEIGQVPDLMKHLSELNKDMFFEHVSNKQFAYSGENIPPKYKILMSLAIGAALGNENCIKTYTLLALRKGITKDEILETIQLTRYVKGTSVIAAAQDAIAMVYNAEK